MIICLTCSRVEVVSLGRLLVLIVQPQQQQQQQQQQPATTTTTTTTTTPTTVTSRQRCRTTTALPVVVAIGEILILFTPIRKIQCSEQHRCREFSDLTNHTSSS
ncbi:conserved hypothetical protein [Trichinella spiralis]|uniref:hypothetical protein n=1 Tax=Trichinella spiralis TaxID=6334 RepID=UPI0001EFE7BF|nr:conserved hypothetical protein [Trichinella spiralis]